jgi:flagellar protein FliL
MAKKPKKAEEPEEASATADEGGEAKPGRSRKLMIFSALGLLALSALGGGGYYFFLHEKKDAPEPQKATKPVAFVDIREMVINLASEPNQDRPRFLKFRVSLEVKDA